MPVPYATAPAVGVVVPFVPPLAIGKVPVTPVVKGKPVAFVRVTDVGVPKIGVTNVGLVDNTTLPEPVLDVTPVPPDATGKVPVVSADVDVAYKAPPDVKDVRFVPPLVVARVPPRVTAPVDAPVGVKPVVPALNDVTAVPDTALQVGKPPDTVRTWPVEPILSNAVAPAAVW